MPGNYVRWQAQTAVCNRYHTIDQQLSRWLLLSLDRLSSCDVNMTQELISNMLGVRREGVPEAAQRAQDAGLIHYHRGRITVLDRPGLERRVCECYAVVKRETDRLLSWKAKGGFSSDQRVEHTRTARLQSIACRARRAFSTIGLARADAD